MAKTIGKFWYRIYAAKRGEEIPLPPSVHITLKAYTSDAKGHPLLSPELATEEEIDYHIQAYKEDLDYVGLLAKRALRRANARR